MMEFGITIPLQRQLKIPAPFYGSERELCYCWELHGIVLQGGRALTAVNASNCYTVVLCNLGCACGDRSGSTVSEGPLPVCKQQRSPGCRFRKRRPVSSRSQGTPHSPGILRAGYEAAGDREVTRKKSYILGGFGGYFV